MAKVAFTAGRVAGFKCPADKKQAFLWDATAPGLGLRVTPNGKPAYVFQGVLDGRDFRITIGAPSAWSIKSAQEKAREIQRMIDEGQDPRAVKREAQAAREAQRQHEQAEAAKQTVTGLDAWTDYIKEGQEVGFTRRGPWGERHYQDHVELASPGGEPMKRGKGTTTAGPMYALLAQPLAQIDEKTVAAWLKAESAKRATRAALAFRLLRGFLNWCAEHSLYRTIAQAEAHKPKEVRRLVRAGAVKDDALQREHLPAWFTAVDNDTNRAAAVYLQALLLTGARPGEIGGLRWEDVDLRFGGSLTIRDKVEGVRVIPCPAYVAHLLAKLPRRGPWVFGAGDEMPKVAHNVTYNHRRALVAAGLPHVSLHGLRRSFGSLSEWVEVPSGIVAQIQGHKPSATAEKHYRVRPLDLLRVWHNKIEAWILEQAGVQFTSASELGKLRVVA